MKTRLLFGVLALSALLCSQVLADNYAERLTYADFDLEGVSVLFTPVDGDDQNYTVTTTTNVTDVWIDDTGLTSIPIFNHQTWEYTISGGGVVILFGQVYSKIYINGNGSITFATGGDTDDYYGTFDHHFDEARISMLLTDLVPYTNLGYGSITIRNTGYSVVVTFTNVDHNYYGSSYPNTFQCEMREDDGSIRITWLNVNLSPSTGSWATAVVGLSKGGGIPAGFTESDLYVTSINGDIDGDGLPDAWENAYFGSYTNCVPTGQGDGDGIDNWGEYVAGTDPTNSASYFSVGSSMVGSSMILNWDAVDGRTYSILHNEDLSSPMTNMATGILPPQNSFTTSIDSAESFYQLDVQLAE